MDPLVVALELSCPLACVILIPRPGIKAASPALQGQFLATGSPRESHATDFDNVFSSLFGVDFFITGLKKTQNMANAMVSRC